MPGGPPKGGKLADGIPGKSIEGFEFGPLIFGFWWPLGTEGAATEFFHNRGFGASWKFLSSSLRTRLGKKCPALAFLRFSNLRSSTNVIMAILNNSKSTNTDPTPKTEPLTQSSACSSRNFVPYAKTAKTQEQLKVQAAR